MMVLNSPSGSTTTTNDGRGAAAAASSVGDEEVATTSTTSPTTQSTATTSMAQKSLLLRRRRLLQQKGAIGGYGAASTSAVSPAASLGSSVNSKEGTAPDNGANVPVNGGTVVSRSSPSLPREKAVENDNSRSSNTEKVDRKTVASSSSNDGTEKEGASEDRGPGDTVPSSGTASHVVESDVMTKQGIKSSEQSETDAEDDASVALPPPPLPPARPSHFARLALLCSQNALYMGARTQLSLCPPGRGRKGLQSALQERRRRRKPARVAKIDSAGRGGTRQSVSDGRDAESISLECVLGEEGMLAYDAEEDKFLADPDAVERETNTDGEEIIEDPSSGDEDDLDVNLEEDESASGAGSGGPKPSSSALGDVAGTTVTTHADDEAYVHREPLYTPAGVDGMVAGGVAGVPGVGPGGAMGSAAFGKLPFNHRKLRWFDSITAADRATARQYLREQMTALKKRDFGRLTTHLKKVQRRDRRRMQRARGHGSAGPTDAYSEEDEVEETEIEMAAISLGVSSLPSNMTPALSAALLLESLSLNSFESLEGVAKCYDGIVAAGTALLEADISDDASTIASSAVPDRLDQQAEKASKAEIMAALIPLLITALEQPSGETILTLAKLRKMCGTRRYQRRFVQRIAPSLIRPPNGAQWCLRHQNDMEPILAATELILDNAFDIFASGWYERGQTLVEDTQRAETLRTAADQLKRLSSVQAEGGLFNINLISSTGAPGGRRTTAAAAARIIGAAAAGAKDVNGVGSSATGGNGAGSSGGDSLAEWEILAVDRQIRESIRSLFTKDWTKVSQPSAVPPRDDVSVGSTSSRRSRGISASKGQKPTTPTAAGHPGEDVDIVGIVGSVASPPSAPPENPTMLQHQGTPPPSAPLSPRSQLNKVPLPMSPQPAVTPPAQSSPSSQQPSPAVLESVFGPSFASEHVIPSQGSSPSKSLSPSPPPPGSPPAVGRTGAPVFRPGVDDIGDQTPLGGRRALQSPPPQPMSIAITPPQTPKQGASPPRPGTPPVTSSPLPSVRGDSTNSSLGDTVAMDSNEGQENRVVDAKTKEQLTHEGDGVATDWSKTAIVPSGVQTPLSPSSVASGGSYASEAPSSRSTMMAPASPGGVGSGPGSGATVSQQSSHSAYLRTLTSTAAERKRTVAACRALRAQIIRFEEAFVQLHGRPPKGAAERAPLATTYAQYREWKRAIRADAACRIQALMRGARVRLLLMGTDNPEVQRIITARRGRRGSAQDGEQERQLSGKAAAAMPSQVNTGRLMVPIEMGPDVISASKHQSSFVTEPHDTDKQQPRNRTSLMPRNSVPPASDEGENDGVEVIISPTGGGQLSPTSPSAGWTATPSSSLPPRRSTVSTSKDGGGRSPSPAVPMDAVPGMPVLNIEEMSMSELTASKRELKQQLKQYDMNFARQHGRMPVKAEKEPIRHLYENYNALKGRITLLEQQQNASGLQRPMAPPASSPPPTPPNSEHQTPPTPSLPAASSSPGSVRRTASPPMTFSEASSGDDSVGLSTPPAATSRKRRDNRILTAPPTNHATSGEGAGNNSSSGSSGNGNGGSSVPSASSSATAAGAGGSPSNSQAQETLQSLKAEKGTLHQMLRSYEKDFFKMHNRQVSSFADIRPVASQYRRYKEIKRAIAALQQGGDR